MERDTLSVRCLEVGVDFAPLADGRNDVQGHQLIAHLAEVLVALVELSVPLGSALGNLKLSILGSFLCLLASGVIRNCMKRTGNRHG